jgi:hypothetical protein
MRLFLLGNADLLVELFERRGVSVPTEMLLAKSERARGKSRY